MSKISAIQLTSTSSVTENLKIVEKLINIAVQEGAKVIVLPEMFPIMGVESTDKIKVSEVFGSGPIQDFLSNQSQKNKIWIVGGTIPIKGENKNKIKAASLVYDNNGTIKARYDKIHLFDVIINQAEYYKESDTTEAGSKVVVVDTPIGKIGLSVCYDIRFPELYRNLFNAGAEIFVIPSAFTIKTGHAHWEILTRSRAIENLCFLIGACQTGQHLNGRKTYGHSLIINPWGEIMNLLKDGTGVITADINLKELKEIRSKMPIKEHQRIFL